MCLPRYKISKEWDEFLEEEFHSKSYLALREFLKTEYSTKTVYPPMHDIFNCMKITSLKDVKVVILGQDPYHNVGQAMGLSFSVPKGVEKPASLVNIFKELESDLNISPCQHGDLTGWAEQGVLLLNTVLTVRAHQPTSHKNQGWEEFTDGVIKKLSDKKDNLVFILWGANAISKRKLINSNKHLILTSVHPSPLSCYRGFFGSKHFSRTNAYLTQHGIQPVDWRLK